MLQEMENIINISMSFNLFEKANSHLPLAGHGFIHVRSVVGKLKIICGNLSEDNSVLQQHYCPRDKQKVMNCHTHKHKEN